MSSDLEEGIQRCSKRAILLEFRVVREMLHTSILSHPEASPASTSWVGVAHSRLMTQGENVITFFFGEG